MSYLIRDQFYGFSKFDSGIKEERANSRKKRLEFLLGLITEDKVELEEQIANRDYLQNQGEADQLPQAIRARKKILQIEKKELLDSIKRVGSFIKSLEKKVKQLNKCLTDKQKEQEKLYSERREKYEEIEEEKQRIEYNL